MRITKNLFFITLLGISIILISCNKRKIYSERETFENYRWFSDQPVVFESEIGKDHIKKPLKLFLSIRYIQGFPYKDLNLRISITYPNGIMNYKDLSIPIMTEDSKYIGDGAGDYWDLNYAVDDNIVLDIEGKYKIEIHSLMKENPVNFINTIGITLEDKGK